MSIGCLANWLRNRSFHALAIAAAVVVPCIGLFWLPSRTWTDWVVLVILPLVALLWVVYDHGYQKGSADAARKAPQRDTFRT